MATYTKRCEERDGEKGEGSLCFLVTKPFVPHLLDAELTSAHGWRKDSGLVVEGDPSQASAENYVSVWVLRADADSGTVRKAVTAHEGVEGADPDAVVLDALRAKAAEGVELGSDEIQAALRLLLKG